MKKEMRNQEMSDEENNHLKAEEVLRKLGITANYIGYQYLIEGICLGLEDEKRLQGITKTIYLELALKYHSSIGSVERNMRTVINAIWRKKPELFKEVIKYPFDSKPSVSQMISGTVGYLSSK